MDPLSAWPVGTLVNLARLTAGWRPGPLPRRSTLMLAQAADLTLAAAPLAAAAGKAGQYIPAAPHRSWRPLPAGSTTIGGLGGFGQGQPLAGAHSFVQFTGQVVCIGFSIREKVSCRSREESGFSLLTSLVWRIKVAVLNLISSPRGFKCWLCCLCPC